MASNSRKNNASQSTEFSTKAIYAGYSSDICTDRPIIPPLFLSATFEYDDLETPAGDFYYSRIGNRNRDILEKAIAELEEADYGLCFSSGMAAIFAVFYLLNPGDNMICSQVLYGGTMKLLKKYASEKGISVTYLDLQDLGSVKSAVKDNTKMIYAESCGNPLLNVVDVEGLANIAKKKPGTLLVIDNTFMTPYFQKPMKQGADIVLHSATKYINGHGDVVMGILVTKQPCLHEKLKDIQTILGFVPSPFDCYMITRSLKTLPLRMRQHMENATEVAKYLESHPLVDRVLYPGFSSHPQHDLVKKQCSGYSGMVGFFIRGERDNVEKFLGALKMIKNTGSLGQPNSLICYPVTVSHASLTKEERSNLGVTDNYLRFSVGLEAVTDIINDLKQAFECISK